MEEMVFVRESLLISGNPQSSQSAYINMYVEI